MKDQHPPCEWCGKQWEPGKKPCSMLDDRTLFQMSINPSINETCKTEVKKRAN